ncbi:hypothetical protein T492DRAFT_856342 [Pavlovales sp. CCMP2436]|nr:hypothetical protein T492DRAFT_856342 [Pavlovales sp. CCMP2436]
MAATPPAAGAPTFTKTLVVICGPPSSGKTAYCERALRKASAGVAARRVTYREWKQEDGVGGDGETRFKLSGSMHSAKRRALAALRDPNFASVYVDDQNRLGETRKELVDNVGASARDASLGQLEFRCVHFLPSGGCLQVRWAYECALAAAMARGVRQIGVPGGPPEVLSVDDIEHWFGEGSIRRAPGRDDAADACSYSEAPTQVRLGLDPAMLDAEVQSRSGLFLDAALLVGAGSVRKLRIAHPQGRVAVMLRLAACTEPVPRYV